MSTKTRNPLAILRNIDAIKAEKRLTDSYKEAAIASLERELLEAQGQQTITMPPQPTGAPTKAGK